MKDVNNKEEVVNLIIPDGNPEILELINNIKAVLEARVPKTNNDKVYLSESEVGAINELTKSIDDTLKYLKDNNISSDSESNKYRLDTKISKIFVSSLIDNGIVDGIAEESNEYTKLFGGMTKLMEYIRNNISSDKPDGQINDCFSFDDSEKQSLSSMF
jgi:hypothetical protein